MVNIVYTVKPVKHGHLGLTECSDFPHHLINYNVLTLPWLCRCPHFYINSLVHEKTFSLKFIEFKHLTDGWDTPTTIV